MSKFFFHSEFMLTYGHKFFGVLGVLVGIVCLYSGIAMRKKWSVNLCWTCIMWSLVCFTASILFVISDRDGHNIVVSLLTKSCIPLSIDWFGNIVRIVGVICANIFAYFFAKVKAEDEAREPRISDMKEILIADAIIIPFAFFAWYVRR